MVRDVSRIDIGNNSELLRLVEAAKEAQTPLILERDNVEVAIVRSIKTKARRRTKGRPMTFDDPIWKLVGSAESAEATDIARHGGHEAETSAPQRE